MKRLQGRDYHAMKKNLVPFAYMVTTRGNICIYFEKGYKHYLSEEEKGFFKPNGLIKIESESELNSKPLVSHLYKAWEVLNKETADGYGEIVFAVTRWEAIRSSRVHLEDGKVNNKRVRRVKFLDDKVNLSEREIKIELIRNGWEFYIIDTLVTKDNVDEAIKRNYI